MFEKIKANKFSVIAVLSGWIVAGTIIAPDIDPEQLKYIFGEAASNQIAQAGFFFTVAAWLHSGRVKKEIKENFSSLTQAINDVASAFREDLKAHSEQLKNLSSRVQSLEEKTKEK